MERTIVKRVRLTRAEASALRSIARRHKTTESDVLREGLSQLNLVDERKKAVEKLIEMAKGESDWVKPRYEAKW